MSDSFDGRSAIQRSTLVEQLLVRLRKTISSGQYEPGTKLPSEADLGALFGVGRSTVREAINVLRHLGDVETVNGVGTFVSRERRAAPRPPSRGDIRRAQEILDFRLAIESRSAEQAAATASQTALRRIQEAWQASLARPRGERAALRSQARDVYRFHRTIVETASNKPLLSAYVQLEADIEACLALLLSMGPSDRVDDVHSPLVKALLEHRPMAAVKAVRHTFDEASSRIQLLLAETR